MLQQLYQVLRENNLYSKSFDEFLTQYQDDEYKKKVYNEVSKRGLYSKDYASFAIKYNTRPNNITQSSFMPSIEMPDMEITETQEQNTMLEDVFGKNLLTDFVSDMYRAGQQGLAQSSAVDETFKLFNKGAGATDAEIDDFISMYNKSTSVGVSDEMLAFQKIYEEEGKDTFAWMKGVSQNLSVLPQLFVSSMVAMARSLESDEVWGAAATAGAAGAGAGAAMTAYGGPLALFGAAAGGIGGAMGGIGGAMETSLTFAELLKAELGGEENFTRENVRALLSDPEKYQNIKERAVKRGIAIGAVETLTGGLAGKAVTQTAKVAGKMAQITAGTAVEAAGGSLGEVAGRLAADQEMDTAEILFEGFAGMSTAPVTVGSALLRTPEYKLNGEKLSGSKFREETAKLSDEAIAMADIEVKNDDNYAKTLYERQNDAILRSQLDTRVKDKTDRDNLFTLEKEKKSLENNTTESAKQRIAEIKSDIQAIRNKYVGKKGDTQLVEQKAKVQKAIKTNLVRKSAKFAAEQGKLIGLSSKSFKTKKKFNEAAQELFKKYDSKDQGKDVSEMDGLIIGEEIIINEERAAEVGAVNVGSHELLHGILSRALKPTKDKDGNIIKEPVLKGEVITDFINSLSAKDKKVLDKKLNVKDKDGNKIYTDEYLKENPDEYLTLLSDAMNNKEITLDAPQISVLEEIITNVLRAFGYKKIKFNTADDVRKFMVEYHKSVQKGELTSGILGLAGQVKGVDTKLSATASNKVQEIYDEQGIGGVADIIEEYKPMAANLANKYRDVPGFNTYKDDLINEILYGERGVLGLVDKYQPGEVPLAAYINKYLKNRSIEAAQKILKTQFEVDVQEITKAPSETQTEINLDPVKQEGSRLRKNLNIEETLVDKIKASVRKTFNTRLPDVNSKKFRKDITKAYRVELKKPIADMMGTRAKYKSFLEKNYEAIIEALPVSTLNKRFPQFSQAVTDDAGKRVREKTAQGNTVFKKRKVSQQEFMDYFLGDKVGASTKGTRKDALAEELGVELAFDATMETLQEPEVFAKFQDIRELTGLEELTNLAEVTAKQIDRRVDAKFSAHNWKDLNKASKELTQNQINNFSTDVNTLYNRILKANIKWTKLDKEEVFNYIDEQKPFNDYVKSYIKHLINQDILQVQNKPFQNNNLDKLNVPKYVKKELKAGKNINKLTLEEKRKLFGKLKTAYLKLPKEILDVMFPIAPRTGKRDFKSFGDTGSERTGFTMESLQEEFANFEEAINKKRSVLNEQKLKKLGFNPKDVRLMNKTTPVFRKNIFRTVFEDLKKDGKISDKTKLEIQNANLANTGVTKLILKELAKSDLTTGDLKTYFQMQTNIVLNFRALSKFEFIDNDLANIIHDDWATAIALVYGEHLLPNASTMVKLMEAITLSRLTKKELKALGIEAFDFDATVDKILDMSTQILSTKDKMSGTLDEKIFITSEMKEMGQRNNTSYDLRPLKLLDKKDSETIIDLDGKGINDIAIERAALDAQKNLIDKNKNKARKSNMRPSYSLDEQMKIYKDYDMALDMARRPNAPVKGISIIDFDDTLATSNSKIIVNNPPQIVNGKKYGYETWDDGRVKMTSEATTKITPAEFARDAANFEAMGATFNFDEFNVVEGGKPGPFLKKALELQKKYGSNDIFVLTARPQVAAKPIKKFLKSMGLNVKLENITGLADGTPQAKADFIVSKAAKGYNDFLFADDAIKNTKEVGKVLDVLDVKGKVYQVNSKFSASLDVEFNKIISENKGKDPNARYSDAAARMNGAKSDSFWKRLFVPPSAEDFLGLMYHFVGKGKKGEKSLAFLKKALIDPFSRAFSNMNAAKQRLSNDFNALNKTYKSVKKKLRKATDYNNFTFDAAIRVYLWDKNGIEIPGISKRDRNALVSIVKNDPEMMAYADQLSLITNQPDGYVLADENWIVGSILSDINNINTQVNRKKYLKEWIDNKEIIFSKDNLNKIEALYGTSFREALEDILYRMENGTNRQKGNNKLVNRFTDWVNNSVGTIMFFNRRSAVLQLLSTFNFINWSDNNPIKFAAAIANFPQFAKDFARIFNSDMLKQRRAGLQTDVSASEIVNQAVNSKDKFTAIISHLLKKGFIFTQIADSFAIATGGATLFRNRVNTYLKQGMSLKDAEAKAFLDFQEISEVSQQSARPDLISEQQAGPLGRIILAFQNTPMQYTRLIKKAALDLANGRGDTKTNISKILYYGAMQNLIFNAMQQALFAIAFDDEEDEKTKKRYDRIANSMADTILRGTGVYGAAISTIKNVALEFIEQDAKGFRADHTYTLIEALNLSPPIGSKARKVYGATQTIKFNRKEISEKGFALDNPAYEALANILSAGANLPLDQVVKIIKNTSEALNNQNQAWQRIALALGWNTWDLGIEQQRREDEKKKKTNKKKTKRVIFH